MYQGDYSSAPYYNYSAPQNPNATAAPPPATAADHLPNPYASAPPFSTSYTPSDYYSSSYPPYPHNPDPVAPTAAAPSYAPAPASAPISAPNSNPPPQLTQSPSFPPSYDSHGAYQAPFQQPPYYSPFDQHQAAPNYAAPAPAPPSNPSGVPGPNKNPAYPSMYSAPYGSVGSTAPAPPPVYEGQYDNSSKYDVGGGGGGYYDERYGNYGKSRSDLGMDMYGKRSDGGGMSMYDSGRDDGYGDGVYAYQGGKSDPYGSRGTAPNSKSSTLFDDYGRPVSFGSGKDSSSPSPAKIVRAVPKVEVQQDVQGGVQKFRVKLLAESGGQSTMDVLCQVGLDGIRMLDPSTNRTLRIYPLETVTRCDVTDSSTFAFWSKSSVDLEPKRIRLQSNSYTTNTILDTVTAATVQFKEMGGRIRPSESVKIPEQPTDRKKGLADWVSMIKPPNEEKDHWIPDEAVTKCSSCGTDFGAFVRKHHCRNCGEIFCDKCTQGRIALTAEENAQQVRVCDRCMAEVTHRLSNAKEAASKPAGLHSHEDLAKKLQEEMERNRKSSSGSKPAAASSGKRMREVACPTCTVHLQVQVPSSGSETIECGVCQHPFLVSAH